MEMNDHTSIQNDKCKLGVLNRPDGSVIFSQNENTVIAGIYGPIEVKLQNLLMNKAHIEVYFRPKSGLPGIADKYNESIIKNTCEAALYSALYPRSSVVLGIQEIENNGNIIGCAINAVCLALIHSGIDLKFLIGSVTSTIDEDGNFCLNPEKIALDQAKAVFVFVFDNIDCNVVATHTSGSFTPAQFKHALELCKGEVKNVFHFIKEKILSEILN